jgi:hypothetical protein
MIKEALRMISSDRKYYSYNVSRTIVYMTELTMYRNCATPLTSEHLADYSKFELTEIADMLIFADADILNFPKFEQ